MAQGIALVVSAPSGAGKSTLCRMLLKEFPDFHYSISCTTRAMRENEIEGKDYYFLSRQEFEKKRASDEFAEWAYVHGHLYGTPLLPVQKSLAAGKSVLFDVDVQGAAQIKASLPQARFVFIIPPSLAELARRLRARGLDDEKEIVRRLANARGEIRQAYWYDAVIVNDCLEKAYAQLAAICTAARLSPIYSRQQINELLDQGEGSTPWLN